ncbi:MAG: hypothetical protein U5N21_18195 [Rhodococcus sp. (in: high G+C Gram-positive bacteria)]|nr:hypothetical protein [Rhodococcus sp. (in: high G+C Gram-positive bacteria)]
MTGPARRTIEDMIERSSLGTASARAARRTVSVQRGRAVAASAAKRSTVRTSQASTPENQK